ncbi:MAG: efflux RND transporter periplasmic adaptor subunit [Thermodesulfovibrio sp.]|nr:efflux RND transporter periplasmic adaptor subunit [Thermodesulfovibrio sp.]MDW7972608.1 efflux RND transporter periplasmic adaptor subunit [Thermodesulfovibrio sp.]
MVYSVYASGYIDSSDSVVIKSEVSGYIEKIMVKEGDEVKKGQLLAVISNDTIRESLKDVAAQLASVKERLEEDSDFRKELRHNIEIKKAILENVEKNLKRREALYEEELISKEKFDEIKREYEVAKRDYEKQINIYNDSIKNLSYQLESLKAKRQALRAELDKYFIRSPINGKILRKFVNVGDYVNNMQQNNALFSVGNEKNLETVLLIDEEYISMVKEGMKVYITVDSYPKEVFEGKIKLIEKQSDRTTRTVKVKADVNYYKPVFLGLTVEANVIIKEVEGVFIPESAYKDGYVEVLEGNKVRKVKVDISPERYKGYIYVREGLKEGQEIIIK